jgi:DUF4097 and DUF4098 domain-containing protein YvlB
MYRPLLPLVRAVLPVTVALALPACEVNLNTEGLTAREKRTFSVAGQPDLTLETFDGAIEIHSWDRNEIEVEVEKRGMEQALLDQMTIEADQQGDRVVLRVKGPASSEHRGITVGVHISPSARLLVAVPRKSIINARTDDGSIRVENIEGRLALRTGDGSIAAERIIGDVEVRSGDGSIRVEQAEGRLDAETEDGSITIDARPSVLRAHTGDGSVRVKVQDGATMADAWDVSTGDGSVTLTLPVSFSADLDAETRDGSVRSEHPSLPDVSRTGEGRERRRELRAKMGEGGPLLKIRTGDGTIRLER